MELVVIILFILSGIASAHRDALSDYRRETIYQQLYQSNSVFQPIGWFMVEGVSRDRLPEWLPAPVRSFFRAFLDGWHVSKLVEIGMFGVAMSILWSWYWVVIAWACTGGLFFLFYHFLLHKNGRWGI